jgi:hypothetical protein
MTAELFERLRDACVNLGAPFEICSDLPGGARCTACEAASAIYTWRDLADRLAAQLSKVAPDHIAGVRSPLDDWQALRG